jgi:plastocyanin
MRRALGLGCAVALWAAAPAAAAPQTVLGTDDLVFAPAHVAVAPGEAVTWRFDGTVQAHNVAANGAEPWGSAFSPTVTVPTIVSGCTVQMNRYTPGAVNV